jgi:hypothetical protein
MLREIMKQQPQLLLARLDHQLINDDIVTQAAELVCRALKGAWLLLLYCRPTTLKNQDQSVGFGSARDLAGNGIALYAVILRAISGPGEHK